MATNSTRRIQQINIEDLNALNPGQIGLSISADNVTGKNAWGGKDLDDAVSIFLEKDQNIKVLNVSATNIRASAITSVGDVNSINGDYLVNGIPHTHQISAIDGISSNTPTNGQVLQYVSSAGEYVPSTLVLSGGSGSGFTPGGAYRIPVANSTGTELTDSASLTYKNSAISMVNGSNTIIVGPSSTVGSLGLSGASGNITNISFTPYSGSTNQHTASLSLNDKSGVGDSVVNTAKYQMVRTDTTYGHYTSQHEWYASSGTGSVGKIAYMDANNLNLLSGGVNVVGTYNINGVPHTHSATDVTSGTFSTARLGSGTASSATYLRGDSTWNNPVAIPYTRIPFGNATGNGLDSSLNLIYDSENENLICKKSIGIIDTTVHGPDQGRNLLTIDSQGINTYYTINIGNMGVVPRVSLTTTINSVTRSISYLGGDTHTHISGSINLPTNYQYLINGVPHTHSATDVTSGTFSTARLGSGTPTSANYLRGDGSWASATIATLAGSTSGAIPYATSTTAHASTSTFVYDAATGRLGIGIAIPSAILHTTQTLAGTNSNVIFANNSVDAGTSVRLYLGASTVPTSRCAYIEGYNDGTGSGNRHNIIFATSNASSSPTEKMRITHDGNVGIGTTPSYNLHVKNTTTDFTYIVVDNSSTTKSSQLRAQNNLGNYFAANSVGSATGSSHFGQSSQDCSLVQAVGQKLLIGTTNDFDMVFGTLDTERMRITGTGDATLNISTLTHRYTNNTAYTIGSTSTAPTSLFELQNTSTTTGSAAGIRFAAANGASNAYLSLVKGSSNINGSIVFSVKTGTSTYVEALKIYQGNGAVTICGTQFPIATGTAGQVLTSDGAGTANWTTKTDATGSFTGTWTGMTATVTATINWQKTGNVVTLSIPAQTGTSNATTFTITGMPAEIRPGAARDYACLAVNVGTNNAAYASVALGGTITFYRAFVTGTELQYAVVGNFTNSGTKGTTAQAISYYI